MDNVCVLQKDLMASDRWHCPVCAERAIPEHLKPLLNFIRGEGEWAYWGVGIMTHPQTSDERFLATHYACREMEQLGLIERHHEEPGLVC